jgi:hypothetical protein
MTEHHERIAEIRERLASITTVLYAEDIAFLLAQLDAAQAETKGLTDAVRWALGEEGEFASPPDELLDRLLIGRSEMIKQGQKVGPNRLYWWRSELREKAFGGVSPEATEGTNG